MIKVGIFSGTFDPIHNGHMQFAVDAIKQAGLERVFFMVEPNPRRKQGVRAFEHRQAMVQLAIIDEPNLASIILEQDRFAPHSTIPLLEKRLQGMELHLLMGNDMLRHLNDWPHVEELLKKCCFVIGVRRLADQKAVHECIKTIEKTRGLRLRYQLFESVFPEISSTQVKSELRKTGLSSGVPALVQAYITENQLYSPREAS